MQMKPVVRDLLRFYPRVFFACHLRHRRDPGTGTLISAHQGSILDHLDDRDGTRVGDLARHMGVTAGTMSIHIDRLERKGFVVRMSDPDDGRRVLVRLTEAGLRVREANSVLDPDLVEKLVDRLTADERRAAIGGLRLLAGAAERMMADRSAGRGRRAG